MGENASVFIRWVVCKNKKIGIHTNEPYDDAFPLGENDHFVVVRTSCAQGRKT